jgi:hypothetical protein
MDWRAVGLMSVDLLQNFTDKFGQLIDRILTAKKN